MGCALGGSSSPLARALQAWESQRYESISSSVLPTHEGWKKCGQPGEDNSRESENKAASGAEDPRLGLPVGGAKPPHRTGCTAPSAPRGPSPSA